MKLIKNCFTFFLALIIFILIPIFVTAYTLIRILTTPDFLIRIVDNFDVKNDGQAIAELVLSNNMSLNKSDSIEESFESIEMKNQIGDVVTMAFQNLTVEDEKWIKDQAKEIVYDAYKFINSENDTLEIAIDTTRFKTIASRVIVQSDELLTSFNFPFPICKSATDTNCADPNTVQKLIEKLLLEGVTSDDIYNVIPKCASRTIKPTESNGVPACIPPGKETYYRNKINELVAGSSTEGRLTVGNFPNELKVLSINSATVDANVKQGLMAWKVVQDAIWVFPIIIFILALLIFVMQRIRGFYWIGIVFALPTLSYILQSRAVEYSELYMQSSLPSNIDPKVIALIDEVLATFVDTYQRISLPIFGVIAAVGAVLIIIGKLLDSRQKNQSAISTEKNSPSPITPTVPVSS